MKTITAICVVVRLTFIQIWSIYATTICNATFSTTTQDKNSLNQHKQTKYTALALEGGGVRGGIYPGALMALEQADLLQHITKFAGTSAGSGTAAFLALGLSPCDILKEMEAVDFKDLVDFSLPRTLKRAVFGIDTFNFFNAFVSKKGFFKGDKLEETFDLIIQRKLCSEYLNVDFSTLSNDDVLQNKKCNQFKKATFIQAFGGNDNDTSSFWKTTFRKIYNKYNNNKKQYYQKHDLIRRNTVELRLTAFDITNGKLQWFDKTNTPNMPISKAIRISSGIPWIFEPVSYNGSLYVDGGVLRRIPVDAFFNINSNDINSNEKMLVLKISRDFQPIKPERLKYMSMMEYTGKLLRTITLQTQDLDLIQRAKDLEFIHFVDFTMMKHIRNQSGIEFDISFQRKALMVETGYKIMWAHILGCNNDNNNVTTSFTNLNNAITMDVIYNYTVRNDVTKHIATNVSCCTCNKYWIKDMYDRAIKNDMLSNNNNNQNWFSLFANHRDYKIERNIVILSCCVLILTTVLGKVRDGLHTLLLNQFSNTSTINCDHCKRYWVPSELSYQRVNELSKKELIEALNARGIVIDSDDGRDSVITSLRKTLKQCVYVENISFRRPWSFLYHSNICPCRWSKDFPFNEWVCLFVAVLYLMSITWTVKNILGKEVITNNGDL